jgi:RNA polymerase sporulation-specific sigma factor
MLPAFSNALLHCFYLILYVTNTNSFPRPLTPEEEQECFLKMKNGDANAKNTLIEHNLRLVAHITKKYYSNVQNQEDLIPIGSIGLIKAINTYDPSKSIKLATYASRCIENEVLLYFRNTKKQNTEVYLSDAIDSDGDGNNLSLIDILSCEDCIDDTVDLKVKIQKLYRYITSILSDREQTIIKMRYGLPPNPPMTQREVACKLNISRSYVSRIEKRALTKLQHAFED